MSDGFERYDMPSGTSLWYRDLDHFYARHNAKTGKKGTRLTGVSTITKTYDLDPSRLISAAAKKQCEGVAERYQMGAGKWLESGEAIWDETERCNLTYDDYWKVKRDAGTNTHRLALEALAKGQPVPDFTAMTEAEAGHGMAVSAFFLDHDPQVILCEQIVYSEMLGVAGRLDLFCSINSRDGQGVIDLKTGAFISAAAAVQVGGGYPRLLRESHGMKSDWALILDTHEDGSYDLIEVKARPSDFLAAWRVYRAAGRINGEVRKAREAVPA